MRCPVCHVPASRIDVDVCTIEVSDADGSSHEHHRRDVPCRRDLEPEDLGIAPDRDVNGVAYLRGAA